MKYITKKQNFIKKVKTTLSYFLLLLFILFKNDSLAQKKSVERIKYKLENHDFPEAIEIIDKLHNNLEGQIIKEYYKSMVFLNKDYILYNLDSSYFHIKECFNILSICSNDEKNQFCTNYQICIENLDPLKKEILWKRFSEIKTSMDANITKEFMKNYSYSEEVMIEAQKLLEDIDFYEIYNLNSLNMFYQYLNKYPTSKNCLLVRKKIEELKFREILKLENVDSLNKFLIDFPNSIFSNEADMEIQKLTAQNVLKNRSIELCEKFILNYPKSTNIEQIKIHLEDLEFERVKNVNDLLSLELFLTKFPNSSNFKLIWDKLDSILSIEEIYKLDNFDILRRLLKKYPTLRSNLFLTDGFTKLFNDFVKQTNELGTLKSILKDLPYFGNIELLKNKIIQLEENKISEEFEKIDLSSIPGYEFGLLSLKINNISFLDSLFIEKLRKGYSFSKKLLNQNIDFKSLSNNWYYMDNVLFKSNGGKVKAISIDPYDYDGHYVKPSKYARSYVFSDSIVLSPNGFFINLFSNQLYNLQLNGINWPLKAFNELGFPLLEKHYGKKCDLPNDSLEFKIKEVNYKNYISNFYNKYNLGNYNTDKDVPDNLTHAIDNFECFKEGSIIQVFNKKTNRIEAILDKNILMMDVQSIQFDRTGQLLIVESINHLHGEEDNYANEYSNKEDEIIIFNVSDFRQLITIPGKLNDLSNQNELILNLNYTEDASYKIKEIEFTRLDLNELIEFSSKFNAKRITNSLNLNEFTTNISFFNHLEEYDKFFDLNNNFNTNFSLDIKKLDNRTNFKMIILEYENYMNRFQELFHDNIKQLNRRDCELQLEYQFYDLHQETCGLVTNSFRENCNPSTIFLTPLAGFTSTTFYNDFGEKIHFSHKLDKQGERVESGKYFEDRKDYFEFRIRAEYIENNHDSFKLKILMQYDSIIDIYSPSRYIGDYCHILNNCVFALSKTNEKINSLFFPSINYNYGRLSLNNFVFDISDEKSRAAYNRYTELKLLDPYDSKLIPPGCSKVPDIHWEFPSRMYTPETIFCNSINFNFFDPIEEYNKISHENSAIKTVNKSRKLAQTISNTQYIFYIGEDQFIGLFDE